MTDFTESVVEEAALEWLAELKWTVLHGPEIAYGEAGAMRADPGFRDVVLDGELRHALARLNADLPEEALADAQRQLLHPAAVSLVERNRAVHRMLVDGVTVEHRRADGSIAGAQARVIDFDEPRTHVRLGELPASSFDARLVGLLVRDTTERVGAARARQLAAAVSAVLRDGFERGLLEELPPRVQLPPPPAGRVVSLTFSETETLLQAAHTEDAERKRSLAVPLVALLLDTGLRLGEALGLDYGPAGLDLAADPPVARIGRSSTKTAAGARTVTLGADAASILRRHRLASGRPADGLPVFTDAHGARLDRHGRVRGTLRRVAEGAGLDSLRAHGIRHAHATFLARADVPPHAAAARLGHADGGALFLRVYAHAHADDERAALQAVEKLRAAEKRARGVLKVRSAGGKPPTK